MHVKETQRNQEWGLQKGQWVDGSSRSMVPELPFNPDDLRLPTGTVCFTSDVANLMDGEACSVLDHVAGRHFFKLTREGDLMVFLHSTPMGGTVKSVLNMDEIDVSEKLQFALVWNPRWCKLMMKGTKQEKFLEGTQEKSAKGYWVSPTRKVVQVGDEGIQVMGVTAYEGSDKVLEPPAIEGWHECLKAVDLLRELETKNHAQEIAVAAPSIIALATGLEYFLKRRFSEMEGEGFAVNYEGLANEVYRTKEAERLHNHRTQADVAGLDYCHYLAQNWRSGRALNFQDLKTAKQLFKKAYGVSLPETVGNNRWETMLRVMNWRHTLVHVSPLSELLEPPSNGSEPVFLNLELVQKSEDELRAAVDEMMVGMGLGPDEQLA